MSVSENVKPVGTLNVAAAFAFGVPKSPLAKTWGEKDAPGAGVTIGTVGATDGASLSRTDASGGAVGCGAPLGGGRLLLTAARSDATGATASLIAWSIWGLNK